jgi:hypothetical protein
MKHVFFLILLSTSIHLQAQKNKKIPSAKTDSLSFPKSFIGHWTGTLYWYPNNSKAQVQTVNMELHIQPADSAGQYTWQIVYGKLTEDNRPYILKPVDSAHGHWVIDEKNGIILDSYWLGNRFSGAFAVQGNTILDSYWIENKQLHVEFFSYPQTPASTTGNGTEESPKVDVYRIGSYQKAVLTKLN